MSFYDHREARVSREDAAYEAERRAKLARPWANPSRADVEETRQQMLESAQRELDRNQ